MSPDVSSKLLLSLSVEQLLLIISFTAGAVWWVTRQFSTKSEIKESASQDKGQFDEALAVIRRRVDVLQADTNTRFEKVEKQAFAQNSRMSEIAENVSWIRGVLETINKSKLNP